MHSVYNAVVTLQVGSHSDLWGTESLSLFIRECQPYHLYFNFASLCFSMTSILVKKSKLHGHLFVARERQMYISSWST